LPPERPPAPEALLALFGPADLSEECPLLGDDRTSRLRRLPASGQEFYAACPAASPNDFAWLALRMVRHKRQSELVPDIDRSIRHDPGAARRDVQYEAFDLRHTVFDRNPGRLIAHLPSRLALYLYPWLVNGHPDHPRWT
jgi:hypothetical protein